jgi:3-methyl-2-oxobutanoate hydroxymethyltransferase
MTTARDVQEFKRQGRRFAMLTAYDFPTARVLDRAGIPVILVGDSLGMVVLGYETTLPVTMEEMLHHCRAVARGARTALLVGDLPFMAYQVSGDQAMAAAGRMMKEGGMHAVKLEGGRPVLEAVRRLTESGVPVMAHLGLTPQSVHQMGGFRVQGREPEAAARIVAEAGELEQAGAFALVLEGVPGELARSVTERLAIPTNGIGAGPECDGQVLVVHDLVGLTPRVPRFAKRYGDLDQRIESIARQFADEVAGGEFPGPEHTYGVDPTGLDGGRPGGPGRE